ncbi:MAG: flagellar basal body P-ring protein FlgI [Limnochordia bacterium]|jgi:flagellar P-ring protein precursor FlgI
MWKKTIWIALGIILLGAGAAISQSVEPIRYDTPIVRIKDVARVQGVRDNQIYGLGLVVGLQGTGDGSGSRANVQMIANMLENFGISVSPGDLRMRNIAAVMVTADLPTSLRVGDRIDVTVSSIGDARSLQGGFLLQTPLQAANGQVFAVAQGPVSLGGSAGRSGSGSQGSHATVGVVPGGAIVERELEYRSLAADGTVSMVLLDPDFTTAQRLVEVVNAVYGANAARARDQSTVEIEVPVGYLGNVVAFIAELEELPIRPDTNARVVVNERTGTVVMGSQVRISPVMVSHGGLKVQVGQGENMAAFGGDGRLFGEAMGPGQTYGTTTLLGGMPSVQDLVDALNAVGATPRDIIAILQAVKAAGALFGELIII